MNVEWSIQGDVSATALGPFPCALVGGIRNTSRSCPTQKLHYGIQAYLVRHPAKESRWMIWPGVETKEH
ncbi:hypothetical protein M404DRAFT_998303 [Pisolithus tinctorius Marx 270]|uniref:Uncharacterized protein n=1 Tax=Pisolithus tinctorius Marx 270 TaxID=870435 RepID=A0A0C3P1E1_PISTI|nr:hypothetical protein M404DRAFT_998303 [Pisolithus tinctorius Marx 270]